ncbi:MAG: hypothetical protein ABJP66_20390, partial [Hyphomicrobiales bacterium]
NPEPQETRKTHPGAADRLSCISKARFAQTQHTVQNAKPSSFSTEYAHSRPLDGLIRGSGSCPATVLTSVETDLFEVLFRYSGLSISCIHAAYVSI